MRLRSECRDELPRTWDRPSTFWLRYSHHAFDFLRRNLMTQQDLHTVIQQSRKQRGIPSARTAAMLLDARSESPRESVTRALLWQGGFPMPTPRSSSTSWTG